MAAELSENSHQGFAVQKQACIRAGTDLSRNLRWGCGHIYDETPVDIAVYVRNDPVNLVDPDGQFWNPLGWLGSSEYSPPVDFSDFMARSALYWYAFAYGYPPQLAAYMAQQAAAAQAAASMAAAAIEQGRQNVLQGLLGKDASNIAGRIGGQSRNCWKYLQGIITKLGISSLSSPSDLLKHLNDATYDVMGDQNGDFAHGPANFGPNGTIVAETNTTWIVGTGPANKVTLGFKFFSSSDPGAVLIHEAFHLFSGVLTFGAPFNGLSDDTLYKEAGVTSAEAFNKNISDNCP